MSGHFAYYNEIDEHAADWLENLIAAGLIAPGLANRWFQPLTHVSAPGFPRDRAISCQRGKRETRGAHRFAVIHEVLQSVSGLFRRLEG